MTESTKCTNVYCEISLNHKRHENRTHTTTWKYFENSMPNEIDEKQNDKYLSFDFYGVLRSSN